MTPERFRILLDSCGADLRRWPAAERAAAQALLASDPTALQAARAEAVLLDRELDAHRVAPPDAALIDRIAGAAALSTPPARRARSWRHVTLFWPRAGWAFTGLAGALAGALVVSVVLGESEPSAALDWQKRGTAFTERAADWSEE
jgi:hypothetical protein